MENLFNEIFLILLNINRKNIKNKLLEFNFFIRYF